jgi:hypothetical protein
VHVNGETFMTDELVNIKIFSTEFEASMAQQILDRSEIKSFISADDAGGMEPQLQRSMGVRLVVNRTDAERALEILSTANA